MNRETKHAASLRAMRKVLRSLPPLEDRTVGLSFRRPAELRLLEELAAGGEILIHRVWHGMRYVRLDLIALRGDA